MTDLEKIELSLRRLGDKLLSGVGGFAQGELLHKLADQIAKDEAARKRGEGV